MTEHRRQKLSLLRSGLSDNAFEHWKTVSLDLFCNEKLPNPGQIVCLGLQTNTNAIRKCIYWEAIQKSTHLQR